MSYDFNTGREYVHQECEGTTRITEEDFAGLCNPFNTVLETICVNCNEPRLLNEYAWKDTGEPLTKYRTRILKRGAPSWWHFYWWMGPLIGAIIGSGFCYVGNVIDLLARGSAASFAFVGLCLMAMFGTTLIANLFCKTRWYEFE